MTITPRPGRKSTPARAIGRPVIGALISIALAVAAWATTARSSEAIAPEPRATALTSASLPLAGNTSTNTLAGVSADGHYSLAVADLDTGQSLTHGNGSFDTASIVKVDILAALLYQLQQEGAEPSSSQDSLATAMIELSDNASATALFRQIGGKAALDDFNDVIGLTETDVGADGYWGLTQTTAADQITVLRTVFGSGSVLTDESQSYIQALMSDVADSQRFGVSAVADDAALKVGYLQRSATGLWDVTSIGVAHVGGRTYMIAFLSKDNLTLQEGMALADDAVTAAVDGFN